MPSEHSPAVSVIVVTYNSERHLARVFSAIPAAAESLSYELIVVDNQSHDSTKAIVRSVPGAHLIENARNIGFAAAVNQGASHAQGEWLFLLNPDLLLDQGMLFRLHQFAISTNTSGLYVPRLRLADGSFHPNCRKFPTMRNLLGSRGSFLSRLFKSSQHSYAIEDHPQPTQVPAVAGTALLVSCAFFQSLGGLDPRFFLYMEDTDISLRSLQDGGNNWFVPDSGGVHYWQEGSSANTLTREFRHHAALVCYFMKHAPGVGSFLFYPVFIWLHFLMISVLALLGVKRITEVSAAKP